MKWKDKKGAYSILVWKNPKELTAEFKCSVMATSLLISVAFRRHGIGKPATGNLLTSLHTRVHTRTKTHTNSNMMQRQTKQTLKVNSICSSTWPVSAVIPLINNILSSVGIHIRAVNSNLTVSLSCGCVCVHGRVRK